MAPAIAAAIIGAGATIGSSALSAYNSYQDRKDARNARDKANEQIDEWQKEAEQILKEYNAGRTTLSSPDTVTKYTQMRDSYDPSNYSYGVERFDKSTYSVDDYLNPQKDAILEDVAKAVQHTAAGSGLGRSSGAFKAMNRAAVEKSEQLYDKAYERMAAERDFDYGEWTNYINQVQKKLDTEKQDYKDQLEMLRGDIEFDQSGTDAATQSRLSLLQSLAQSRAQLV